MNLNFYRNLIKKELSKSIKRNDVVYIESDLTSFRQIFLLSKTRNKFLKFFFKIFSELVGKRGTIILPSFSYSWGDDDKKKIFDIKNSKSRTGILSEFLLKQKNVYRSLDPMFSCLVIGNKKKFLEVKNNTFGPHSIFEKLLKNNAKLVSFGLKRFDPTFVHYVEQYFDTNIKKIDYRYLKKISGLIKKNNKKYRDTFFTFLKNRQINKSYNEKRIKKDLVKQKKLKILTICNSKIYIVDTKSFFKAGINGMKKNINYFAR